MQKRKSSTIAGIVITAMILYGTFSLITTLDQLREAERINTGLKTEIEEVQEDNRDLSFIIYKADTDSAKEALARERLGLVKPGEKVYIDRK